MITFELFENRTFLSQKKSWSLLSSNSGEDTPNTLSLFFGLPRAWLRLAWLDFLSPLGFKPRDPHANQLAYKCVRKGDVNLLHAVLDGLSEGNVLVRGHTHAHTHTEAILSVSFSCPFRVCSRVALPVLVVTRLTLLVVTRLCWSLPDSVVRYQTVLVFTELCPCAVI